MMNKHPTGEQSEIREPENIEYLRQMLGELRRMADREGAEVLSYLIDMAYLEAEEIQSRSRRRR